VKTLIQGTDLNKLHIYFGISAKFLILKIVGLF
jgi:hypothetical protein